MDHFGIHVNHLRPFHEIFTSGTICEMKTTNDIKRENLQWLIDTYHDGVRRRLELSLGKVSGGLNRYFSDSASARDIGKKLARQIEKLHDLPDGWLMTDHSQGERTMSAEELMVLGLYRKAPQKVKLQFVELLMGEPE